MIGGIPPGVISNEGNLSIFDSTITRNRVLGGFDPVVLANLGGQLSVFDTVFSSNFIPDSYSTTLIAPDGGNSVAGIFNTGDGLLSIDRVVRRRIKWGIRAF